MIKKKIIYVICLIGIIWMNVIYVDRQIFLLLVLFAGIPIVSWIILQLSKRGLNVQVITKAGVIAEKSNAKIMIRAVNDFAIPVYDARLMMELGYLNDDAVEKDSREVRLEVSSYYKKGRAMRLNSKHCGIMQIDLKNMVVYDLTGLFRNRVEYKGCRNIVIMPHKVEIEDQKSKKPDNDAEEYRYDYISLDNTEVMELRPYVAGDAINHIHWNLSSKNDEVIVKKFGNPVDRQDVIIVDLSYDRRQNFRSVLDEIYRAAYSIGDLFVKENKNTSFLAWNEEAGVEEYITFDDEESLDRAMIELMSIRCSENAGIEADRVYLRDLGANEMRPVFITMKDYVNRNYRIVNVSNGNLREMMQHLDEEEE